MSVIDMIFVSGYTILVASGAVVPISEMIGSSKHFKIIYKCAWITYLCAYILFIFGYIIFIHVILS